MPHPDGPAKAARSGGLDATTGGGRKWCARVGGLPAGVAVVAVLLLILAAPAGQSAGAVRAQAPCPPAAAPSPAATPQGPPVPGGELTECYPAGWNLVGGAGGFAFSVPIWVWDPVQSQYTEFPPETEFGPAGIGTGQGAWAYFPNVTAVEIPAPPPDRESVSVAGRGEWQQIGDPFTRDALVCGTPVYTYDPTSGTYSAGARLRLGQGGWIAAAVGTEAVLKLDEPGGAC